jgi:hypothetical protein
LDLRACSMEVCLPRGGVNVCCCDVCRPGRVRLGQGGRWQCGGCTAAAGLACVLFGGGPTELFFAGCLCGCCCCCGPGRGGWCGCGCRFGCKRGC